MGAKDFREAAIILGKSNLGEVETHTRKSRHPEEEQWEMLALSFLRPIVTLGWRQMPAYCWMDK